MRECPPHHLFGISLCISLLGRVCYAAPWTLESVFEKVLYYSSDRGPCQLGAGDGTDSGILGGALIRKAQAKDTSRRDGCRTIYVPSFNKLKKDGTCDKKDDNSCVNKLNDECPGVDHLADSQVKFYGSTYAPLSLRAVRYVPRAVGKVGHVDLYDSNLVWLHRRDLYIISRVLKANTIRLAPWVNSNSHRLFFELCREFGLFVIPTFDLGYFFTTTVWREAAYSEVQDKVVTHFDEFMKNVRKDAPVLMWSINHGLLLNETCPKGKDSANEANGDRTKYFQLIKAIRRIHYKHEWNHSTKAYLRPLALPLVLDSAKSATDVGWFTALAETTWAKWPTSNPLKDDQKALVGVCGTTDDAQCTTDFNREDIKDSKEDPACKKCIIAPDTDDGADAYRHRCSKCCEKCSKTMQDEIYEKMQEKGGFDVWIVETMPKTEEASVLKTVDSLVLFNDSKPEDEDVFPNCGPDADECKAPMTTKAAVLQYGFAALVEKTAKLLRREVDVDHQQRLLSDVWKAVDTKKSSELERIKHSDDGARELAMKLEQSCVDGAVIDEWADDWDRCATMGYRSEGFVQNVGGVCDELKPGELVHVEWFGLNAQYSFYGQHCIDPRFLYTHGFQIERDQTEFGFRFWRTEFEKMSEADLRRREAELQEKLKKAGKSIDEGDGKKSLEKRVKALAFKQEDVVWQDVTLCHIVMPSFLDEFLVGAMLVLILGIWMYLCCCSTREKTRSADQASMQQASPETAKEDISPMVKTDSLREAKSVESKPIKVYAPLVFGASAEACPCFDLVLECTRKAENRSFKQEQADAYLQSHLRTQEQRLYHQLESEALAVQAERREDMTWCLKKAMFNIHSRVLEGYIAWLEDWHWNVTKNEQGFCCGLFNKDNWPREFPGGITTENPDGMLRYIRDQMTQGDRDRNESDLWAEALLYRLVESLSEQALHSPEFLAAFYHQTVLNRKPIELGSTASPYYIRYSALHSPLEALNAKPDPYSGGINFDDINDHCIRRDFEKIDENMIDKMSKEDWSRRKSYRETSSVFVVLDIISNFQPVFMVKIWLFGLAWYSHMGKDNRNLGQGRYWMLAFFQPKFQRARFVQITAIMDAFGSLATESALLIHGGCCQKRRSWMAPRGAKIWIRRRLYSFVVALAGTIVTTMFVILPRSIMHVDTNAREDEVSDQPYEPKELKALTVCAIYWVCRFIVFICVTRPESSPFLNGRPKERKKRKAPDTAPPTGAGTKGGPNGASGLGTPLLSQQSQTEGAEKKKKTLWGRRGPGTVWLVMFGVCFWLEANMIAPLADKFDWDEFCGNLCTMRRGTYFWRWGSDCFACNGTLAMIYILVLLTGFFDIYYIFYFGTSVCGYVMGEKRGLRDALSTTHSQVDLASGDIFHLHKQPGDGGYTGQVIRTAEGGAKQTHGQAMHQVFGASWRMIWSRVVEALRDDCLIKEDDAEKMVEAGRTIRWHKAWHVSTMQKKPRGFAEQQDRFKKVKFISVKARSPAGEIPLQKTLSRCISELRVEVPDGEGGGKSLEKESFERENDEDGNTGFQPTYFSTMITEPTQVIELCDKLTKDTKVIADAEEKSKILRVQSTESFKEGQEFVIGDATFIFQIAKIDGSQITLKEELPYKVSANQKVKKVVPVVPEAPSVDNNFLQNYKDGDRILEENMELVKLVVVKNLKKYDEAELRTKVEKLKNDPEPCTMVFRRPKIKFNEVCVTLKEASPIRAVSFRTSWTPQSEAFDPVQWKVHGLLEDGETWKQLVWQETDFDTPWKRGEFPVERGKGDVVKFFAAEFWRDEADAKLQKKQNVRQQVELSNMSEEVNERLGFFVHTLPTFIHKDEKSIYKFGEKDALLECHLGSIPSLSQIIPVYDETVIISKEKLKEMDGVNTNLAFIISQYPHQWTNFAHKLYSDFQHCQDCRHFLPPEAEADRPLLVYSSFVNDRWKQVSHQISELRGSKSDPKCDDLEMEVRMWASMRSQTVARTVVGAIQYHEVLSVLPGVQDHSDTEKAMSHCVELVLAHQTYGKLPDKDDKDVVYLLKKYGNHPFFLVFDYDENICKNRHLQGKVKQFMKTHHGYYGPVPRCSVRARYRKDPDTWKITHGPKKGESIDFYTEQSLRYLHDDKLIDILQNLAIVVCQASQIEEIIKRKNHWELVREVAQRYDQIRSMVQVNKVEDVKARDEDDLSDKEGAVYKDIEIIEVLPRQFPLRLGSGNFATQGKAANQLGALRFSRGHYLQMMDANMGAFLGEAAKVPFILRRFQPPGTPRTDVQARIIGFRETIFTHSHGAVGAIMASAEWSFGTICQRFLKGLGMRMHYGHPDFLDGFWASNRGSLSKASPAINLSEDIFAGFNVTMRGEKSSHVDSLSWEKGRETSFNGAAQFFTKVSTGNVGVMRSRDLKLITENLGIFDNFSFYFASIGFYLNNLLIDISVSTYVLLFVFLALSSKTLEEIGLLDSMLATEWIFSLGIVAMLPRFFELILEYGPLAGIIKFIPAIPGNLMMFTFINKSIASGVSETMMTGEANYISTGRPNANTPYSWRDCYFFHVKSHYYPALKVLCSYMFYEMLSAEFSMSSLPMFVVVGSVVLWIIAPIMFCPQPTLRKLGNDLVEFWLFIIDAAEPVTHRHDFAVDRDFSGNVQTTEEKLKARTKKDEKNANLYEFWLKEEMEHKKNSILVRLGVFFLSLSKLLIVTGICYSTMLDDIWDVVVLLLFHFLLMECWRRLNHLTIFVVLSLLMWIFVPLAFHPDITYIGIFTPFLVLVLFLDVLKQFLLGVYWFWLYGCCRCCCCRYRDPDWKRMPTDPLNARDERNARARLSFEYDYFVEYLYVGLLTYTIHLYAALVVMFMDFVVHLFCAALDQCGIHSMLVLSYHLARRRGKDGYVPAGNFPAETRRRVWSSSEETTRKTTSQTQGRRSFARQLSLDQRPSEVQTPAASIEMT